MHCKYAGEESSYSYVRPYQMIYFIKYAKKPTKFTARFGVITEVTMNDTVFWDMM